eukprot:7229512-Prymnesium_polylepis.1
MDQRKPCRRSETSDEHPTRLRAAALQGVHRTTAAIRGERSHSESGGAVGYAHSESGGAVGYGVARSRSRVFAIYGKLSQPFR